MHSRLHYNLNNHSIAVTLLNPFPLLTVPYDGKSNPKHKKYLQRQYEKYDKYQLFDNFDFRPPPLLLYDPTFHVAYLILPTLKTAQTFFLCF